MAKTGIGPYRPVFAEPVLDDAERKVVERFSDLYYSKLDSGRGLHTIVLSWMGHELFKCPLDLWIYQELIIRERPDLIVEIGTYKGGSALYLAHMCDAVGAGTVVSVDIDATHAAIRPQHERIRYVLGSSIDPEIFASIKSVAEGKRNVMVILDGDHRCEHVLKELLLYQSLIRPGGYMIVEDTNINGHPTYPEFGPGPWEAVSLFLDTNPPFKVDRTCERFLLTMNPRGYLRRLE
jgi:cephalosporin hydroxylase